MLETRASRAVTPGSWGTGGTERLDIVESVSSNRSLWQVMGWKLLHEVLPLEYLC